MICERESVAAATRGSCGSVELSGGVRGRMLLMVVAGIGLPVLLAGYWWELVSRQLLLAGAVAGGIMWWAWAAAVMLGGSRRMNLRTPKR